MAEITVGAEFKQITDKEYRLINIRKKGYDKFVKDFENENKCIVRLIQTEIFGGLKWAKILYRNA